jgi:hypothetical protein
MGAKTSNQGAARNHFFIFDKWFSSNRPTFVFSLVLMRDFTTSWLEILLPFLRDVISLILIFIVVNLFVIFNENV